MKWMLFFYNRENEFANTYVCIFKINGTPDGDYYIVYQQDKNNSFNETVSHLNEGFNSSRLRGMSDDEWNEYMKKRAEKVRSYRK